MDNKDALVDVAVFLQHIIRIVTFLLNKVFEVPVLCWWGCHYNISPQVRRGSDFDNVVILFRHVM